MSTNQQISVGIVAAEQINFCLDTIHQYDGQEYTGTCKAVLDKQNEIKLTFENGTELRGESFLFTSQGGHFSIDDVIIGVDFHWERKERQRFEGDLKFIIEDNKIRLINILSIDAYLCSVISSEMSATSSIELLKAHTVVSRSWLLAQIAKSQEKKKYTSFTEDENERVRWYDREDHQHFDVCADDHCQRYQGLTRQLSALVQKAVKATSGQVLRYEGKICDTRYYKCCGGITETFENCWEPEVHPYLTGIVDNDSKALDFDTDLRVEENARKWILSSPEAFCKVKDKNVLKQVLNDFDQSTVDFYRWQVNYSQEELAELIKTRSGIDFGKIKALIPLARGTSGRIYRLKIVGSKRTFILGKELEIRKALSPSHLYSSAFVVDYGKIVDEVPESFHLYGAGWGHGVGLCQIGAALMAEKGYNYKQILAHYFKGAILN